MQEQKEATTCNYNHHHTNQIRTTKTQFAIYSTCIRIYIILTSHHKSWLATLCCGGSCFGCWWLWLQLHVVASLALTCTAAGPAAPDLCAPSSLHCTLLVPLAFAPCISLVVILTFGLCIQVWWLIVWLCMWWWWVVVVLNSYDLVVLWLSFFDTYSD